MGRAQRGADARQGLPRRTVRRRVHRLCRRPQSRRRRPDAHELQIQAGRNQRHDAEVRLRAPQRRKNQSEVRLDARRFRRRPPRRACCTRWDSAPIACRASRRCGATAARSNRSTRARCWKCSTSTAFFDKHIDYSSHRDFKKVSVERNFDGEAIEVGQRARVGVLRAREDRPVTRRSDARRSRRAQADGDLPPPLGQQVVEPAADVREREDGRLRASARDDSGCGLRVRSEESRPRPLAIEARLARFGDSAWCR